MQLSGKSILLGVTGSISAYKSAELTRLLIKEGASVKVLMTPAASEFISPLTLSVLSKNPVLQNMTNPDFTWNNHIDLGIETDLFVIAPASANTISAFAQGRCDNLLQAVYLSARSKVLIAPAMDHDMYLHPATRENLRILKDRGNLFIGPEKGELASGIFGEGRLSEPENILQEIIRILNQSKPFQGMKALVTAGPTIEPLDPVRFISNHSTGKMGVAIANALNEAGAEVILVAGPLQVEVPRNIRHIPVKSAQEMLDSCLEYFTESRIIMMTAAVADYTPAEVSSSKIKKKDDELSLRLEKTTDILAELGKRKHKGQILAGFALETDNEEINAKEKLVRKNLDFIVLNSLRDEGAGFGTDTNKITIIDNNNKRTEFPLKSKQEAARDIVQKISEIIYA